MSLANQYKLSWEHFEDINPNKQEAFENLCRSLFWRTKVADSFVLHSNPNHPGVEVDPVLSIDGKSMISFQSKYFSGKISYSDIKDSLILSVKYFGNELDIVYIYSNKKINTQSKQYKEIVSIASSADIRIILVTGQSILDEAMNYSSVLASYFGINSISLEWFQQNLDISLKNLGQRYNASFSIDTNAQKLLSLFLKEPSSVGIINNKKTAALNDLKKISMRCKDNSIREIIHLMISSIEDIKDVTQYDLEKSFEWKEEFINNNRDNFKLINDRITQLTEKLDNERLNQEKYDSSIDDLQVLKEICSVSDTLTISDSMKSLFTSNVMVITGDMGTGKSHLIASSAKRVNDQGRYSILLLGQSFMSENPIDHQIMDSLINVDMNESMDSLLAAMDEHAFLFNTDAVVFIDAINESHYKRIWKVGINRLVSIIRQYNNIRLVLTLRSGYEEITLSDSIIDEMKKGIIPSIVHRGFNDESPEKILEFLSYYGIPMLPDYYLQQEMSNPLFLTWFCKTYTNETRGVYSVIDSLITTADKEASISAGFSEPLCLLKDLLEEFVNIAEKGAVTRKMVLELSSWDLFGVKNKVAYINSIERSGVLIEYVNHGEEYYYLGYNLLEEFIRASLVLGKDKEKETIINDCSMLLGIDETGEIINMENLSIFSMVASLYADRFDEEFLYLIDDIKDDFSKREIIKHYLRTLTWRDSKLSLKQFIRFVNNYRVPRDMVWSIFVDCSTNNESELNADGLTKVLMKYPLNKRDYIWTIVINRFTENDRVINLAYYLERGLELKGLSDKKTLLLMTLYAWMLASSNRVIRDRISKAMIEVLSNCFGLCEILLNKFIGVNDPYIIQRLYGIFFGAVMRRKKRFAEEYRNLAMAVYSEVFSKEKVYPDILLRDYARLIIERYIHEFPENEKLFNLHRIRPPYNSDPIPSVEEIDLDKEEYCESGLERLLYSLKFDIKVKGFGLYGDFGRYVFQSAINQFVNVDNKKVYYYAIDFILKDLGYSNDLFGEYDIDKENYFSREVSWTERIGKKYEWITMYNILARLSDTHNVVGWELDNKEGDPYQGPWNPYVRDFDPTVNIHRVIDKTIFPVFEDKTVQEDRFINVYSTAEEAEEWILKEDKIIESIQDRLIKEDQHGLEWVSMFLHQENQNRYLLSNSHSIYDSRGGQCIWVISSLNIVDVNQDISLELLWESDYIKKGMGQNTTTSCYSLFSREYAWSPGYSCEFSYLDDYECKVKASNAVIQYLWEEQYDASRDEATVFYIPAGIIINTLGLYEKEMDGVFYHNDELVAFDTGVLGNQDRELLIRRDVLNKFCSETGRKLFWNVVGEKQFFFGLHNQKWMRREGYFLYDAEGIKGTVRTVPNI